MKINNTSIPGLFTLSEQLVGLEVETNDILYYEGRLYKVKNPCTVSLPLNEFVTDNLRDLYKDSVWDPTDPTTLEGKFLTGEHLIQFINTLIGGIGPGGLTQIELGKAPYYTFAKFTKTGMYSVYDPKSKKDYLVIVHGWTSTKYNQVIIDYQTPSITINLRDGALNDYVTSSYSSFIDISDFTKVIDDMQNKLCEIKKSHRIAKLLTFNKSGSSYEAILPESFDTSAIVTICMRLNDVEQISRVIAFSDTTSEIVQDEKVSFSLTCQSNKLVLIGLGDSVKIVGAYYY